jgi:hypothetical protein
MAAVSPNKPRFVLRKRFITLFFIGLLAMYPYYFRPDLYSQHRYNNAPPARSSAPLGEPQGRPIKKMEVLPTHCSPLKACTTEYVEAPILSIEKLNHSVKENE